MATELTVGDVMTTEVMTFAPDLSVEEAIRALVARKIGAAPVVDGEGRLLGLLSDDDLLIDEARLHFPTVVQILGAQIAWPPSVHRYEEELRKSLGATVGEVMDEDPPTALEADTIEDIATRMHEDEVRRLAVVRDGMLVGIISRGDVLRAMLSPRRDTPLDDG
jgi:CBS domain-containing protein